MAHHKKTASALAREPDARYLQPAPIAGTLVDSGVHYDFGGGLDGVRLALNARNLFDKRYINCQEGYCYRGEARSVVTSLSYRW